MQDIEAIRVVCVDLDGTLIATDTLWELLLRLTRQAPWLLLLTPLWLLRGRAHFKAQLASRFALDVGGLPYRREVLDFLRQQKEAGAALWLTTGADERIAHAVADHLGLFDGVLCSNGRDNLTGRRKMEAIIQRLGSDDFDYVGNGRADLPLWEHTRRPIVAGGARHVLQAARNIDAGARVLESGESSRRTVLRALRVHQWAKNALVFVPLLFSHQFMSWSKICRASQAALAFCLAASAVYIFNDLLDLETDRRHPDKRCRPFAAGELSIVTGLWMIAALAMGSAVAAQGLGWAFGGWLLIYALGTTLYSMRVKRLALADALMLAGLYVLRLIAGGAAVHVPISRWLAIFSLFFFTSLAFLKRYIDLRLLKEPLDPLDGRGYIMEDLAIVRSIGICSGLLSILVFAMYIDDQAPNLYRYPWLLWLACPVLLYWLLRLWLLGNRGQVDRDPIVFAVRDGTSWAAGCIIVVLFVIAAI